MEGRQERDPGYDDWFDEPEPPTDTHSGVSRSSLYDDAEEVWVLPEDEAAHDHGHWSIVVGGRTLTATQVAIIAVSVLALFFAILAAAGVFNSGKTVTPPVPTPKHRVTVTLQTSTAAVTTPTTEAPAQTLSPGDTGSQVKVLQQALKSLGYAPGTPDGDYGPSTQIAVEKFQAANGLAEDGVVGEQTLAALQKALSG
ncbi:MAG TPA: peptidoglycan-binding domain-containing protein [Gaiellaceae bacterium]|nr:peptidoglycan-binding domain-containing protein [Gaiellaceae bacterium]